MAGLEKQDKKQDESIKTFYTALEICYRYRISRIKLYRLIKAGEFPAGLKIGRDLRWNVEDIAAYEAKSKNQEAF